MITVQVSVSKGWLYKEGGFAFNERYYLDPLYRWQQDRAADKFVSDRFPDLPIYNMESNLVQARFFDPNQVIVGGIQPNMLLGIALGASFTCPKDRDADISAHPLRGVNSPQDLPLPMSLLDSEIFRLFDSQIQMLKKDNPDLKPIPPFFWDSSGRATIHGLLTTAQKLFGEDAFVMMMDRPADFQAILFWIADCYVSLIRHYAEMADIKITSIHIGECSGAMIGNDHFSKYILPQTNRLGDTFGSVRMHSCGLSDHLIDGFSKLSNLTTIDTGSGTSIAKIRSIMSQDFLISTAPPVEFLSSGTHDNGLTAWLLQTLKDNHGGPLQIQFHIEPEYSMQACLELFDQLVAHGISVMRVDPNNASSAYPG